MKFIALFGDAITRISPSSSAESFDNTIAFIKKGIAFSEEKNNPDFVALGYNRMSQVYLKMGDPSKALDYSTKAVATLVNIRSDSVKSLIYLGMGDAYLARGAVVDACKNYNNAFDLAMRIHSASLLSQTYHSYSGMYLRLGYSDLSTEELYKSLDLNQKTKDTLGLIRDYIELARITDNRLFIDQVIKLSSATGQFYNLLFAKKLLFYYYCFEEKNPDKSIHYLNNEPELKASFINSGIENYYRAIGNVYSTMHPDSALKYYQLANEEFLKKGNKKNIQINFFAIAECYAAKEDFTEAISYYKKSLEMGRYDDDFKFSAEIAGRLSNAYRRLHDYRNALHFADLSSACKDSLKTLGDERDVALLGVARENKKHALELMAAENSARNKRNRQYVMISIMLVVIFISILAIGSFTVPKYLLRFLGFLFFVSMFEFIVLLIDHLFLSHSVGSEPLKLWAIKIGLVALLVPLQNFLEKQVIGLLESRKLVVKRNSFSFRQMFYRKRKPAIDLEGFESDGVL